ncbi:uncharacterized protein BKA55DRAFT_146983 [Fusarium redolens]|uniref:SnoaL-like domain-containing protein n=1 Tax=Fusarium redolens TaxID=48865 RepID=A0A9P9G6L5_FUSRE|nr:uncharacterized protein BKA55DRAFT_146983 [Fusarium redolens]KAH7232254.1 hypothetical protein BKA55DRAFT_146983 [Fusarium redolens]
MPDNELAIAWPSHITDAEKQFFNTFYQLLDGSTPEEGKAWSETFAPDGEFRAFGHVFKGHAATEKHIKDFWKSFPGLKHQPLKAYTYDPAGLELIILTNYEMTCPDGSVVEDKSAAQFLLKEVDGRRLIEQLTLYLDPQVLTNTLAKQAL